MECDSERVDTHDKNGKTLDESDNDFLLESDDVFRGLLESYNVILKSSSDATPEYSGDSTPALERKYKFLK